MLFFSWVVKNSSKSLSNYSFGFNLALDIDCITRPSTTVLAADPGFVVIRTHQVDIVDEPLYQSKQTPFSILTLKQGFYFGRDLKHDILSKKIQTFIQYSEFFISQNPALKSPFVGKVENENWVVVARAVADGRKVQSGTYCMTAWIISISLMIAKTLV